MKVNPGTSGLAQNISSRANSFSAATKVVQVVQMAGCSQNEY
ncbi:MAG TPA: hypothetical protein P5059_02720 [Candidatus Dojkabacteria bacterium]|jgi:hypothetical protein|nr:hypothetical protein [Candidatus Dojkabacteria bacterium]